MHAKCKAHPVLFQNFTFRLRAKYPSALQVSTACCWRVCASCRGELFKTLPCVQGAIAASAPVGAFASKLNPDFNPSAFWEVRSGSSCLQQLP